MATEDADPRYRELDTWPDAEILAALLESQARAVAAVRQALPQLAQAADKGAEVLRAGGRWAYAGAGTSGRIALQDGVELVPTFGLDPERLLYLIAGGSAALTKAVEGAEDDSLAGAQAVREAGLGAQDLLIALAASGKTPFTLAALKSAREQGAFTIGIANNAASPLLESADLAILLDTGPEVLTGSTRLSAGTAQKIALNLFSTLAMIRFGKTYGNLMVGLKPTNAKLWARATNLVAQIAGCDPISAAQYLQRSGGQVNLAVLLARGLDLATAQGLLAQNGGNLRQALGSGY